MSSFASIAERVRTEVAATKVIQDTAIEHLEHRIAHAKDAKRGASGGGGDVWRRDYQEATEEMRTRLNEHARHRGDPQDVVDFNQEVNDVCSEAIRTLEGGGDGGGRSQHYSDQSGVETSFDELNVSFEELNAGSGVAGINPLHRIAAVAAAAEGRGGGGGAPGGGISHHPPPPPPSSSQNKAAPIQQPAAPPEQQPPVPAAAKKAAAADVKPRKKFDPRLARKMRQAKQAKAKEARAKEEALAAAKAAAAPKASQQPVPTGASWSSEKKVPDAFVATPVTATAKTASLPRSLQRKLSLSIPFSSDSPPHLEVSKPYKTFVPESPVLHGTISVAPPRSPFSLALRQRRDMGGEALPLSCREPETAAATAAAPATTPSHESLSIGFIGVSPEVLSGFVTKSDVSTQTEEKEVKELVEETEARLEAYNMATMVDIYERICAERADVVALSARLREAEAAAVERERREEARLKEERKKVQEDRLALERFHVSRMEELVVISTQLQAKSQEIDAQRKEMRRLRWLEKQWRMMNPAEGAALNGDSGVAATQPPPPQPQQQQQQQQRVVQHHEVYKNSASAPANDLDDVGDGKERGPFCATFRRATYFGDPPPMDAETDSHQPGERPPPAAVPISLIT